LLARLGIAVLTGFGSKVGMNIAGRLHDWIGRRQEAREAEQAEDREPGKP
jgi:hypothetical protein